MKHNIMCLSAGNEIAKFISDLETVVQIFVAPASTRDTPLTPATLMSGEFCIHEPK